MEQLTDEQLDVMVKKCAKGSAYLSSLIREQLKEAFLAGQKSGWEEGYVDGSEDGRWK